MRMRTFNLQATPNFNFAHERAGVNIDPLIQHSYCSEAVHDKSVTAVTPHPPHEAIPVAGEGTRHDAFSAIHLQSGAGLFVLRQTEEIPSLRHLSLALATIFIFLVPFLSALIRGLERCAHETDEELAFSVPPALVFPARHANCQSLHARREPRAVEVQFQVSPPGSRAGNRKVLPPHHQEPGEEVAEATARHAQPRRVLLFQEVREPQQY